jgi:hypothetical protein
MDKKKKKIDTLIEDIYKVFEDQVDLPNDLIKDFGTRVSELVKNRIEEVRSGPEGLRLSQIGTPNRKIWYGLQNYDKKPLTGQDRLKFLYGDLVEELLLLLIKLAGHTITDEQKTVTIEGVVGHQDCRIDNVITDIKSASSFGFRKFKDNSITNGNDPFGYIAQLSAYTEGQGEDSGAFLVLNKENADLHLLHIDSMDMINATDRIKELKGLVDAKSPPARCYSDEPDGVSGNRVLPVNCVWCSYKHACWSDSNDGKGLRIFKYSKGSRYFTQVYKTPNVQEVT